MNKRRLLSARVALLSVLLLSGHTVAYGQKIPNRQNPLLPDVHLGLNKLGAGASIVSPPAAPKLSLLGLPSVSVPDVAVRVSPAIVPGSNVSGTVGGGGVGGSVTVPPIDGLTPPIGVDVSGSTLGVSVGDGGIPGVPPAPNFPGSGPTPAAQEQLLQQRLALLPTCR